MLIKLSTQSCLQIRMQEEVTVQIDNSPFGRVKEFKYLGTTSKNQNNSIQEEIKADRSQGMLAIIRCRIFCLPVCWNYNFACCFVWVCNLVTHSEGGT